MSDEGRRDAGGSVRPGWARQPVGRLAVRGTQGHWLTGSAAELLLTGRRVHPADEQAAEAAGRLAGLLAAAGGQPPGSAGPAGAAPVALTRASALDPAREEAALAAFRAVHGPAAHGSVRRGSTERGSTERAAEGVSVLGRTRAADSRSARRQLRMTVAAVASVVALSGAAMAVAATSGRLGLPGEGSGGAGPASSRPPVATTVGAGAAGTATDVPGARVAPAPPPASLPSAPADSNGAIGAPHGSRAWCVAYLRGPAGRSGEWAAHCRELVKQQWNGKGDGKNGGAGSQGPDTGGSGKGSGSGDGQGSAYSVENGSGGGSGQGNGSGGGGGQGSAGGDGNGDSGGYGQQNGGGNGGAGGDGNDGGSGAASGNGQASGSDGADGTGQHSGSADSLPPTYSPPAPSPPGPDSVSVRGPAPAVGSAVHTGRNRHRHHRTSGTRA
jgi:hypothetical protein